MRIARCVLAALAVAGCSDASTSPGGEATPAAIPVTFAGGTVRAELATTRRQRESGLSNRAAIAPDSGMLFVWPADQNHQVVAFWMKDTHFDLSIAFLDASGRVINVEDMTRETLTYHYAAAPFRYAIEVARGWFAAHGVTAGATANFTIPPGTVVDP